MSREISSVNSHAIEVPLTGGGSNTLPNQSRWNGQVVVDASYYDKNPLAAGAGPGMFDGMWRTLVTISIVGAAIIAALAVGIATASLQPAFVTFGIIGSSALVVNLVLRVVSLT